MTSLPTPPKYVVLPEEYIEQAFNTDKPKKALLATFIRLLSLAWQAKYQQTPALREEELYDVENPDGTERRGFLRVSRRQYFEQKADMEWMGWLRSSHPRPGFVQFSFSRELADFTEHVVEDVGAENSTGVRKTALELKRMEEEDSLINLKTNPPHPSSEEEVRKIAPVAQVRRTALEAKTPSEKKMQALIAQLHLVFDPGVFGVLEWRAIFLASVPAQALGWIAKAYADRERLTQGGGAIGLIVKHLVERDSPHIYYLEHYAEILPEAYLEAVGEFEIGCEYCTESFSTRQAKGDHERAAHPYPCGECAEWFTTQESWQAHYDAKHNPLTVHEPDDSPAYATDESIHQVVGQHRVAQLWQLVLGKLKEEMPKASFETWVQSAQVIRYGSNVLTVGVRNTYTQDWLTNRLTARVNQLLIGLTAESLTVQFVVATEVDA